MFGARNWETWVLILAVLLLLSDFYGTHLVFPVLHFSSPLKWRIILAMLNSWSCWEIQSINVCEALWDPLMNRGIQVPSIIYFKCWSICSLFMSNRLLAMHSAIISQWTLHLSCDFLTGKRQSFVKYARGLCKSSTTGSWFLYGGVTDDCGLQGLVYLVW